MIEKSSSARSALSKASIFAGRTGPVLCLLSTAAVLALSARSPGHAQPAPSAAAEDPELAVAMSQLQYFTHKLALSIEARNVELAAFYLHEVEEVAEAIRDEIPEYEGHPVGPLVGSMLLPPVERLEATFAGADWQAAETTFGLIVDGCNACHSATEHGFIVIEAAPGSNPYIQSFQPGG